MPVTYRIVEAILTLQKLKPEGGSCDCNYRDRAIRSNHRGHQAKSQAIEHSFDDVDNRGWFRTSDFLHVRGRAGGRDVFLRDEFDPKDPNSPDGDRFVLSKGHAAPVLYAALAGAGVFPESRLMTLREFSSELEGHPTPHIPGVDAATGSLGQGLSVGLGLAIGARMDKKRTRVYVLMGDGEMAEGQVWEAAAFAAHYKLDNITVLADINALGQSEPTMYQHDMEIYRKKFDSEGWATEIIDGHDVAAVLAALDRAKAINGQPQAILARTIKGNGVSFLAGKEHWHGKPIPKDQLAAAIKEIGPAIDLPPDPGKSYARTSLPKPPNFPAPAPPDYDPSKPVATREAYGFALKRLGAVNPHIVAISGDVKNSTFSEIFEDAFPDHFYQGYIAEQNIVSAGVGLAARGKVPFLDTFRVLPDPRL